MTIWSFFITSFIIVLLPGTGVIYTISTGLAKGKKASILAATGCTLGIIPHLCASIAVSSLLMRINAGIFWGIKLAGALYLLYLGINMLLPARQLKLVGTASGENNRMIIRRGILINLLNPKLTLFFFSFLPQYVRIESPHYALESLGYGLAFMLLTFIIFIGYGALAGSVSTLIMNAPKMLVRIQQLFGLIFIAFAIHLGISSI